VYLDGNIETTIYYEAPEIRRFGAYPDDVLSFRAKRRENAKGRPDVGDDEVGLGVIIVTVTTPSGEIRGDGAIGELEDP
jgi:hypothetical protein